MLTDIWFVRHAEADRRVSDPPSRPLTEKGRRDRLRVADCLRGTELSAIFSSPYRRAVETLEPLAQEKGLPIHTDMAFAEFHAGNIAPESAFLQYIKDCFDDPTLTRAGGESFCGLVKRQEKMLNRILQAHAGKAVAVGTHGLALSALLRRCVPAFGFRDYEDLAARMPLIARLIFDGASCAGMQLIDPLTPYPADDFCAVETAPPHTMNAYRFVVIFARHKGRWVFCRARSRASFELPGGHIENSETPLEAARRELYEETGAKVFSLSLLCDYRVRLSHEFSNGQVFWAEVEEFAPLPAFEMAEIRFFDDLPSPLRFPKIYPALFEEIREYHAAAESPQTHS